jgi:hypothetical protein
MSLVREVIGIEELLGVRVEYKKNNRNGGRGGDKGH